MDMIFISVIARMIDHGNKKQELHYINILLIKSLRKEEKAKLILRDSLENEAWCSGKECTECTSVCDARQAINQADAISPPVPKRDTR